MSAAAAHPAAAALRVLRRAAGGRRLLRVLLFLGGLLTVGFLYGGQAHAADTPVPSGREVQEAAVQEAQVHEASMRHVPVNAGGPSADTSVDPSAGTEAARKLRDSAQGVAQPAEQAAARALRPVRTVAQSASSTVGDLARTLSGPLAEPLKPVVPDELTPSGGDEDQSRTPRLSADRRPAAAVVSAPWSAVGTATSAAPAPVGVQPADGGAYARVTDGLQGDTRHQRPVPVPAPAPDKPCGTAPGALQQTGDKHTPRTGEQATTTAYGADLALVPGGGSAAAGAPTRERSRDILEFPG